LRQIVSLVRAALLAAAFSVLPAALPAETMRDIFPDFGEWLDPTYHDGFGALEVHSGTQTLSDGIYDLNLGDRYYALLGNDARWVMETLWENLPDPSLQAMVFRKGTSPLDGSWSVAVFYFEDGHISDDEAGTMDYDAIIAARKDSEPELNRLRREQGIPELNTVGLVGKPGYDAATRALKFSVLLETPGADYRHLNANAWVLSRHGYVNLNVIGVAEDAASADAAMPELIGLVSFTPGNRYADYVPGVDAVAEGGLGGLLGAGGAQAGLLVLAIALLKKFGFLLAVPVIWLVNRMRRQGPTA
jgi:uncharacterized membrane-anchored protein